MDSYCGTSDGVLTKSGLDESSAFVEVADVASEGRAADLDIDFGLEESLEHLLDMSVEDYDTEWGNVPHTRAVSSIAVTTHVELTAAETT